MKTVPSERSDAATAAEPELLARLDERLSRARPVLVVSPPRSASTAFARALGHHSRIQRYFHEPCGRFYYERTSLESVLAELEGLGAGALIKEMTFQLRSPEVAESFFRGAASPTIFLARSPLLTIESRIRMVLRDLIEDPSTPEAERERARAATEAKDYRQAEELLGDDRFPLVRTGWTDLARQLDLCRERGIDYVIVESSRFRAAPEATLRALCPRLGLDYEPGMLSWTPRRSLPPGALERHAGWYARVDASTGILPPSEETLPMERFPFRFREHLPAALATYERALADPLCL